MKKVSRRKLIAALSVGGVVTASKIPATWSRPVIDGVALPAHAQTTGAVLSGSEAIAGNQLPSDGGSLVDATSAVARRILEAFVEESVAQDEGPPILGEYVELFAYCQSMGSSEFLVQAMIRVGNPYWLGDTGFASGLITEAMAGTDDLGPDCYAAVLYERTISVSEIGPGIYRSAVVSESTPKDSCGVPPEILESIVGMQLEVNDSSAPTVGTLYLGPPGSIMDGDAIILSPGGNPLFADCRGDECEVFADGDG